MADIFNYNQKSMKAFIKFYQEAPGKAKKATARMLSQFAFGTREEAIKQIKKTMTVRNERFVKSSIIWRGARIGPIESQQSSAGSIRRGKSTGWAEQQDNKTDKRTRSQSLLARGNNFNRKVKPSVRMKQKNRFFSSGSFGIEKGKQEVPRLIRKMKRDYKNKPFIIKTNYKQIKRGVYKFVRKKMMILQNFEKRPKGVRRNPWMDNARANFFKSTDIDKEWGKAIDFILKKKKF